MGIEWTADLAVGVDEIDDQHKALFTAVDRLCAAVRAHDDAGIRSTLQFLAQYAQTHFATEETQMRRASYPAMAAHVAEHRAFVEEFVALEAEYERVGAKPSIVLEMNNWLFAWLREHIRKSDIAFGTFLNGRAAAGARPTQRSVR